MAADPRATQQEVKNVQVLGTKALRFEKYAAVGDRLRQRSHQDKKD